VLAAWPQEPPSFRSHVELVEIPCAVVDAKGAPVGGLKREDFRVFDNDTPRVVQQFWADDDTALTLGVIVDESESQREQVEEHRAAAEALLKRILRPGDTSFVMHVAVGSSPLWDAVYEAAHFKLHGVNGSKALLILTDGFDNTSVHTWRRAADEVHKAEANLYAIQYPPVGGSRFAPDLYRLVAEAGGATLEPPRGDYARMVARIETDLRHRYVLGFRPEVVSGKARHEVRVEVARPGVSVRARRIYFR